MRLADRIFAPHYAAPMPRTLASDATLTATKNGDAIGKLAKGETFEVLEITAEHAWGVQPATALVGYIPLSALAAA